MSKAFAYHIFAHDGGRYRTISAAGISELESKSMEQFFFGQTNDDAYLASLEEEPGIIWRNLNGRGALTRVKNGQCDSSGRATLRFETILFPASQRAKASQKLDALVLSSWEFKEEGAFLSSSGDTEAGEVHPEKISDVSMAIRDGGRVVRRATEFSLTDVAKIVSSCGDSADFSLCFKSLNNTAPVTVNLTSLEVQERDMKTRPVSNFQNTFRPVGADNAGGSSLGSKTGLIGIYAILLIQLIALGRSLSQQPSVEDGLQEAIQKKIVQRTDELKEDIAKNRADAAKDVSNLQGELKVGFESATKRVDDLFLQAKNEIFNKLDAIEKSIVLRQKEESESFSALNSVLGRIDEKLKTLDKPLQEIADMKSALEKMKTEILVELAVLKDRVKSNDATSAETDQAPSKPTRQGEKGSQK